MKCETDTDSWPAVANMANKAIEFRPLPAERDIFIGPDALTAGLVISIRHAEWRFASFLEQKSF